jgi:penicillin-binding protein 2
VIKINIESNKKLRFALLYLILILAGMLLIGQLVKLQIIKGNDYRLASQSRLFREATTQAPRGEIFDKNGLILATNREAFKVEIVRTPIDAEQLARILLMLVEVIEKNNDTYVDNFPMTINPIQLDPELKGNKLESFKKKFKIKEREISDEDIFKKVCDFYKIPGDFTIQQARKVVALRYEMNLRAISQFDTVTISEDVSKETVAVLEERHLDFPGVSITVEPVREYPLGTVASHIIGYIGKISQGELDSRKDKGYKYNDVTGKDGLENTLEEMLKGKDGLKRVEMDSMGRLTGEIGGVPAEPGNNIYLTIDLNLQKVAEKALKDTIEKINSGGLAQKFQDAKSGSAVAIDVKTGEILAMANYPSYDPSVFVKGISLENWRQLMDDEQKPMFNRAIKGLYSPGSTFKMVTALAALQDGAITVNERVLDQGVYKRYKDYQPRCWIWSGSHSTHGYVNVSDAIKVSCNYFFYEMGYRTGIENLDKYVRMFGLGSKTGVELPGEKDGIVAGPEYSASVKGKWYPGNALQAAIGQSDFSFTPLQMANYIATLANEGVKNRPHLLKKVTTWNGKPIDENKIKSLLVSKIGDKVNNPPQKLNLNKRNLDAVFSGMASVTGDAGGTAYGTFANFPVKIAGKTGTVQVPGHYKNGAAKSDNAWFVGFAPYDNPQIAVAVLIEHGGHGAYTAPVARDILAQYFGFYKDESQQKSADKSTSSDNSQTNTQAGTNTQTLDSKQDRILKPIEGNPPAQQPNNITGNSGN